MKESWSIKGEGDPGTHIFNFINEVNSTAKNHVIALGGNVLLSYRLQAQESGGRAYRNQTYNVFTLTGDVALVLYSNSGAALGTDTIGDLSNAFDFVDSSDAPKVSSPRSSDGLRFDRRVETGEFFPVSEES